jgi:hypothetical protein
MENEVKCPVCHMGVRPTDYFCFNCGKNLKPKPLSTVFGQQLGIYLESIFLPPYGVVVGLRYLKQKEGKSKIVGAVAVVLTILSIVIFTKLTLDLINNINVQVNKQMQQFGTF